MTYSDVVLPNLGFGMEEGRVVAWLKQPGDTVRKGDALAEIEGDKTTVELEALADGVLAEVLVAADHIVPVGSVLARIRRAGAESEPAPAQTPVIQQAEASSDDPQQISPVARRLARDHGIDLAALSGSGRGGRITREDVEAAISRRNGVGSGRALAAPAVRRLARDHGIDLAALSGSGRGGRITRADVEAALQAPQATPADTVVAPAAPAYTGDRTEVALSQMRKAIARRLKQSMSETPHFYVTGELDFTDAIKALPSGTGINALLLYLAVKALKDVPELNATYEQDTLYHYPHVNLGIAVALPAGLIVPVLFGADDFSLSGIANRSRDLVARARDGRLQPDEMQGGTFTVSNLGVVQQIDQFTAIINPPQVGILAVGAVKERSIARDGGLHIRTTAHLTLSADHRIVDGMVSARFIEAFDAHLQAFNGS
jgi:pyruvate dehydrogenase E2 component (dihydrolipoamide acetyltransferase)